MTIIFIIGALLLIASPVTAQTTPPTTGPVIWQATPLTSPMVTITNGPMPKCDDGWTLVLSTAMQPMCARELRKPR